MLSTSLVFAEDNSTTAGTDTADYSSTAEDIQTVTSESNTNVGTISDLRNDLIDSDCNLSLSRNYTYDTRYDEDFLTDGIFINHTDIVIEGNNYTIDMNGFGYLFKVLNSDIKISNLNIRNTNETAILLGHSNLTTTRVNFENKENFNSNAVIILESTFNSSFDTFTNLKADTGSAIQVLEESTLYITNATFNISREQKWGTIYLSDSTGYIFNTTFDNMHSKYATAIYDSNSALLVNNCSFINLDAEETAGAIGVKSISDMVVIENCNFINVTSDNNGGALFVDVNGPSIMYGKVMVINSEFDGCGSDFGGAILQLGGELYLVNSRFNNNYADTLGGAVYTSKATLSIMNSTFNENGVPTEDEDYNQGGALYFDNGILIIQNSRFEDNKAFEGSDAYLYDAIYQISDSYFAGNVYSMFDFEGNLTNNTFLGKNVFNDTEYIYVYESNGSMIEYDPLFLNESLANASYFDLRDYGLVSPVKNQGNMGSCWTFGVTGSLESAYLKATNKKLLLDISESNIQDSGLVYYLLGNEYTEGSYRSVGTSYMLSWLGVTTSEDNSYDELGKISAILDNGSKYHVHNVVIMQPRANIYDNQKFKDALVKYGAVGVSVHGASNSDSSFNDKTNAAYFYNETFGYGTDHTVTLVGWNDSFSRYNFVNTPPGDGAWIIKNSWGSDWADEGYYYVSYYDTAFATNSFPTAFIIENNHNYEKNYQYDIISDLAYETYSVEVAYANNYTSIGNDLISAVGTYFNDSGVKYHFYILVNNKIVHSQSGISSYPGYDTIKLDKLVALKENDTFIVEMHAGNTVPVSSKSRQHYKENTSFILTESTISDVSARGYVVCLKAYTIPDNSYVSIDSYRNIIEVTCFDEYGEELPDTEVIIIANGVEYTVMTDDEGVVVLKLDLPAGKHTVTVINPVNGEEVNITLTIPSNKPGNTGNVKKVKSVQSYRAIVKDKVISSEKRPTNQSRSDETSQNLITGHLVFYIDGKVIFNITIVYDMAKTIFEFINSLLGNNEVKSDILKGLPGNYELKIDVIKGLPGNYEVKLDLINSILQNNGVKSEIANSLLGSNELKIDYINSLLSNHDVKLEYTVDNDTTSYNENVTTN